MVDGIEYAQFKGSLSRKLRSLYFVLEVVVSPREALRRHVYTGMGRVDLQAYLTT